MGSGEGLVFTDFQLNLEQFYLVEMIRSKLKGILIVDGTRIFTGTAGGKFTNLDLQSQNVYLGIAGSEAATA